MATRPFPPEGYRWTINPEILDTVLKGFEATKAQHAAEWDRIHGVPPSSTCQALSPNGPQQDFHGLDQRLQGFANSGFPRFLDLPCELTMMIWKEAARQYLETRKPICKQTPKDDGWKRVRSVWATCPIKNVCKESRAAYMGILDGLRPTCSFEVGHESIQRAVEQYALIYGPPSELFLRDGGSYLTNWLDSRSDGIFRGLKTLYLDLHIPSRTQQVVPKWGPLKSPTMGMNYYRAYKTGPEREAIEATPISPRDSGLYENALCCDSNNLFPQSSRVWLWCSQMRRRLNGPLEFIYSTNIPGKMNQLQLIFLFMLFGPHFNQLPQLERIIFVKAILGGEDDVLSPNLDGKR